MPRALIISAGDLREDLGRTILWRSEVQRAFAADPDAGVEAARSFEPNLVVIDFAAGPATALVRRLREDPVTRRTAIAVLSRDPFLDDAEKLRRAGANVVVPPDADPAMWDARLEELLRVPRRREARIPVQMETWSRRTDDGEMIEGSALDISVHGLLLEASRPLDVGVKLDLRFRLPGEERELQALGEVVRQDELPRSGIKFLVLRGEAREAIRSYVESGGAEASRPGAAGDDLPAATEGREWEAALRASEGLKAAILDSAMDCIVIMDHEGRILEINRAVERTLGYTRSHLVGRTVGETIAPASGDDPNARAMARYLATGGGPLLGQRVAMMARQAGGANLAVELTLTATSMRGRRFYTAYLRDVSDIRRGERLQRALFRIADTSATVEDPEGLYPSIHNIVGELMYAQNFYIALRDDPDDGLIFPYFVDEADAGPPTSQGAKTLTGYVLRTGESLLASPAVFSDLVARGDVETVGSPSVDWLGVPLKTRGRPFGVLAVQSYHPAIRYSEADKDVLTFVSHQIAAAIERRRADARIEHLAYHDALTGLPNRHLLVDRLDLAVAQARRDENQVGVLSLGLDRFKAINDSLGHAMGDELLRAAALRLQRHVRKGDTLARIGGDEFTVLVRGLRNPGDAAKVAQTLQAAVGEPFTINGRELFVTASIGISLFPDDGADVETLLRNADTALYRAKDQGHDTFRLYTPSMNAQAVERLKLDHDLRRALSRRELSVDYQPVINLAGGDVHGVEALLRWKHPERGLVPPSEFIPLAETTGLLGAIGPWVIRAACAQARAWQDMGHSELRVAVNISARQLQHMDLVGQVTEALEGARLDGTRLELEITETSAMQNPEATIQTLTALKALGVRISIDDFGIGYSSLNELKRLPIDTLKIDHSFVRDIPLDPDDAAIATAIITLAHTLELMVVAEGVETAEQLAFLAARGCDRIQGYIVSRPVSAEECGRFLAERRGKPWSAAEA